MMSEAQHTPGPWSTDPDTMHQSVLDANGVMVADCAIFGIGLEDSRSDRACEENARLIAAAPDMAAEIAKQIDWLKHARTECAGVIRGSLLNGFDQSIKYLTAVLAKARGEG